MARVLLVDDDRDQLEIRQLLLAQAGHEVHAAGSVAEALQLCQRIAPERAVLDLCLPRPEDGLALIRRLHAFSPATRLYVLSGLPGGESAPEADLVEAWLVKPLSSGRLLDLLAR